MNTPTPTPRTDAAWSATFDEQQMSAGRTARALRECSQQLETELAALRADKIRLDALDAILAENAWRARLGWRCNLEGPESDFNIRMSQDGKMRSIRQALDVMLAVRKEGSK